MSEEAKEEITLEIEDELYEQLCEIATEKGITLDEFVAEVIESECDRLEQQLESDDVASDTASS